MLESIPGIQFLTSPLAAGFPVASVGFTMDGTELIGLIAAFESVRRYSLALGIGGLAGGILLFINHKKQLDAVLANNVEPRIRNFETRKYRRRATASAMIASVGCMLSALYWVSDARVFSAFILMILSLLIGILGVALFDLFSVGLQQIASPDEKSRKAMIEEFLRKRDELSQKKNAQNDGNTND